MLHLSRICILSKTMSILTSIALESSFPQWGYMWFPVLSVLFPVDFIWILFHKTSGEHPPERSADGYDDFRVRSLPQWQQYDARILRQRVLQIRQSRITTKRAFEYATVHDHTNYRNAFTLNFLVRSIDTCRPRNEMLERILKLHRESIEIVHQETPGSSTYASSYRRARRILSSSRPSSLCNLTVICDRPLFCKTLDFQGKDTIPSRLSSERETECWNTSSPTWQSTSIRMIVMDQKISQENHGTDTPSRRQTLSPRSTRIRTRIPMDIRSQHSGISV